MQCCCQVGFEQHICHVLLGGLSLLPMGSGNSLSEVANIQHLTVMEDMGGSQIFTFDECVS